MCCFNCYRHRDYYKSKKCIIHCDKNEMPVAELYRTIEEHIVLKGRLETEQVIRELIFYNSRC